MVTIYNTTLSATSQRHFSDGLGGVKYDTPTCELIELDTTATLCQASGTGTFELPAWGEDDLGLNF